jgi:hypothetical protein
MSKNKGLEVIEFVTSALEEMNKELEAFLVTIRGEKKCAICNKVTNDGAVCNSCYQKDWKDVNLNDGRWTI